MSKKDKEYKEIDPGGRFIKKLISKIFLMGVGISIQTAYRFDPEVKKEMDTLPDTFSFCFGAIDGPTMLIQKRNGFVQYLGEKEVFNVDLDLRFKNIEYLYLVLTGRISTPEAAYHNRQFVKGNLGHMMLMLRVLAVAQTLILPNFISRFYLKKVPRLTLKTLKNRTINYINVYGFAGLFK
jgi:hypothetical protein